MRADRLLSMLMLLQTRGRMTAEELAGELEVSSRTVYRDLDALTIAGVPVYADRGPSGGISLWDDYRTNLTGLTRDEVRALFMLTVPGLFADLQADQPQRAATLKLMASLPAPFKQDAELARQRIHLDPAAWFHPAEPTPYLLLLQDAIWQNRRVRMTSASCFRISSSIKRAIFSSTLNTSDGTRIRPQKRMKNPDIIVLFIDSY